MFLITKTAFLVAMLTIPTTGQDILNNKDNGYSHFLECDGITRNFKLKSDAEAIIGNPLTQTFFASQKLAINNNMQILQSPKEIAAENSIKQRDFYEKSNCRQISDISHGF